MDLQAQRMWNAPGNRDYHANMRIPPVPGATETLLFPGNHDPGNQIGQNARHTARQGQKNEAKAEPPRIDSIECTQSPTHAGDNFVLPAQFVSRDCHCSLLRKGRRRVGHSPADPSPQRAHSPIVSLCVCHHRLDISSFMLSYSITWISRQSFALPGAGCGPYVSPC